MLNGFIRNISTPQRGSVYPVRTSGLEHDLAGYCFMVLREKSAERMVCGAVYPEYTRDFTYRVYILVQAAGKNRGFF